MTRLRLAALLLMLLGAVGIVYGILAGEIQVGLLFFVIPYLYGSSALGALSILAIVIGVFLLIIDAVRRAAPGAPEPSSAGEGTARPRTGWGGVVIVGPVPIVFGSTPRLTIVALVIAAAILTMVLLLFLFVKQA